MTMDVFLVLALIFQVFKICYGRDISLVYTVPRGGCPHHELDNLRPNTTYTVTVTSIIPGRSTPLTEVQTLVSDPAPLNSLRAWNVGTNDLSVFWLPGSQTSTEGFIVQIVDGNEVVDTRQARDANAVNDIQFENLTSATLYDIELIQSSQVISSTRIVTRPRPPTFLTLINATTNSLFLQWQAPADNIDHYEVCYHPSVGILTSTVIFKNEIEISGLIPGTVYTFTVTAIALINGFTAASTMLYGFYKTASETNPVTTETLQVSSVDQNTVRLSWGPISGSPEAFDLDYSPQLGYPPPPIRIPASQSSIEIGFLQSSTDYQISLTATIGRKLSRVQSAAIKTSIRTDDGPFNIAIFNVRDTSAVVLYGSEQDAESYSVMYGPRGEAKLRETIPADIPRQYSLWNLMPATEYSVDVAALNANGEILNQRSTTFMTLLPPSVTPTISQSTATSSTVNFPLPSGDLIDFNHYEVQLHFGGDESFGARIGEPILVVKSACASLHFEDLRPDSLYEVVTSVINGDSKTLGTVVGISTRFLGPLEVSAAVVTTTTIEIIWGPGLGDFTQYELTYSSPSLATFSVILESDTNRHVLDDLEPGTIYSVTLTQIGGAVVLSNTAQLATRPLSPTNLRATTVRTQSATFRWTSPHDMFSVCYFPQGDSPTPYVTSSNEVTLTGLQRNTTVRVTVFAVSQVQFMSYRSESVTVSTTTLVAEPGEIQVDSFTTTTIDVSWIGLPGTNIQYRVEYFNVKRNTTRTSRTTSSTEYSITGLAPGELYNISVVPVNTEFLPSSTLQRTTPNPPGDIIVTTRDVTSIALTWQLPIQTEEYEFLLEVFSLKGEILRQMRVTSPTTSVNDLRPGTTYTFAVSTVSGMGVYETVGDSIDVTTATLLDMRLSPGQRVLRIAWDPVDFGDFACYEITYSINNMLSTSTLKLANDRESIFIENLPPGSMINIEIEILNAIGDSTKVGLSQTQLIPLEVFDLSFTARRTELSLNWNLGLSFYDGFEVLYQPMDGIIPAGNISRSLKALIVGLTPGQEYTVNVTTISNGERSKPVTIVAITLPERIPSIDLVDLGEGRLSISWEQPDMRGLPAKEYIVRIYGGSDNSPIEVVSDVSMSTILIYEGDPGFYYSVEITSVVVGLSGMQESDPVQQDILLKPLKPQLDILSEEDIGATFAKLSWTVRGTRSFYELIVTPAPNDTDGNLRIEPHHVSTCVENLVPLTSYNVTISAVSQIEREDDDVKEVKSPVSFLSFTTKIHPPRNLSAVLIGRETIRWTWLPPIVHDGNTTYRVELITPGTFMQQDIFNTTFIARELNAETEYTLRVQTKFGEELSLAVESTVVTGRQRPSVINGFGIPGNTVPSTEVTLEWGTVDPQDGVTSILIKIDGLQKGGDARDSRTESTSSEATSFRVTNLLGGYSYNFSICAANEFGSSEPATEGPILIPETAPPRTTMRVSIVSTTSTSITVGIQYPFFSDVNGPIVNYALLVTQGSEDIVVARIPNTYLQSQTFGSIQPPYQATPDVYDPYHIRSSDGSGVYIIGVDEDCTLISNFPEDEYCNGPLQPSTSYRVALRGYGKDGNYQDSPWSEPAVTGYNLVLVAVISACFILFILILMVVLCCICCCLRSKRGSRPKRRRLYPENELANHEDTSLQNFRLPGEEDSRQNDHHYENVLAPELTSYRKKRGTTTSKRYKKKKRKTRSKKRQRDGQSTSTHSLEAESTIDDLSSSITTLATATSNPIAISMFQNHVAAMATPNNEGFVQEFQNMEAMPINMTTEVAMRPENKQKNRYRDILPYDATRVILSDPPNNRSDYINASHLQWFDWGRYICAQAPLPDTVNDFWQMIWENKTTTIVMLTKLVERGRTRCEKYWPDDSESLTFGNLEVTGTGVKTEENWQITSMQVTKNDVTLHVNHYHFLDWPDHGIPMNPLPMVKFIQEVRKTERSNLGPLLVHCSAGCGRSGTYIVLYTLMKKSEMSTINDKIDVLETVYTLRQQRMKIVQNSNQYVFLHRCLAAYIQEMFFSSRPNRH